MHDEEPTQRAPQNISITNKELRNCIENELYHEIAAYACTYDCKHIALTTHVNDLALGLVIATSFTDTFCNKEPLLYIKGCIIELNTDNNKIENIMQEVLSLPYDKIIYTRHIGEKLTVIFECSNDKEKLSELVYKHICKRKANTNYSCINFDSY